MNPDQKQAIQQDAERDACRDDGRCQYAIDHGAEGMGHCPKGKCAYAVKNVVDNIPNSLGEIVSRALISKGYSGSTTMNESQREAIKADAERAAQERQTPNEKCPHPFSSEQGRYWVACYEAEWGKRWGAGWPDPDRVAVVYDKERRGK